MTELSDELLVAYVDGQLAKDQSKAVEQVLENDDVAAERVAALRAAHAHLETAFESMLAGGAEEEADASGEAAPAQALEPEGRSVGESLRVAGLLLWVGMGTTLIGGAAGYVLYEQIEGPPGIAAQTADPVTTGALAPTWQEDLGRAYALLSRETFTLSQESEGNADLVRFQLSKALDAELTVPDLSDAGLGFDRATLLQREGEPIARIVYLPETGEPVALYVKSEAAPEEGVRVSESGETAAATWADGGLSYLLMARLPAAELGAIAAAARAQTAGGEQPDAGAEAGSPDGTETGTDSDAATQADTSADDAGTPARP